MNSFSVWASVLAISIAGSGPECRAESVSLVATAFPAERPELTATLVDPINIDLKWTCRLPAVRGYLVEYTSDPRDEYVILAFAPAEATTFRHPDLAPHTPFFYRIRPFLGEASDVVSLTTGKIPEGKDATLVGDAEPVLESPDAKTAVPKKSLRHPDAANDAAPSELTATQPAPLSVTLRWSDRANDEDGYLVEAAAPGQTQFDVIAFLAPNTIGFTVFQLPPETLCRFRVRAFHYGPSSNVVQKITGVEPANPALKPSS